MALFIFLISKLELTLQCQFYLRSSENIHQNNRKNRRKEKKNYAKLISRSHDEYEDGRALRRYRHEEVANKHPRNNGQYLTCKEPSSKTIPISNLKFLYCSL
jgi:hypothetical protein